MGDQDRPNSSMDEDCHSQDGAPGTDGINTVESRFIEFCKNGLSMDENCGAQAAKLLSETEQLLMANTSSIGSGVPEEAERYWFACILYAVRKLGVRESECSSQQIDGNRFTLCQILRHAKLSISDFFKELPQFVVKAGSILSNLYGEDWEKRLEAKELQVNVIHLSLLSKFYKRAFQEFFLTSEAYLEKHPADPDATSLMSTYYRFGWLLFLALRGHMFSRFKDLVTCTNGLVSILAILIIHIPIRFRNFSVDSPHLVMNGDKVDLIASLCKTYETAEDELRTTLEKTNNLIRDLLGKTPLLASECTAENLQNINPDCFIYCKDLLEGSSLSYSLSILEKDYEEAMLPKGELDERIYVNEEDSLLGSGSLSGGSLSTSTAKRKLESLASPEKSMSCALSPFRSPSRSHKNGIPAGGNMRIAATPVSTAMTTVKWLRAIIAPLQSKPSVELEKFLSSCDKNITNDVVRRSGIILEAIFPSSGPGEHCATGSLRTSSLMDNIWAEQRRLEALKLYYRVLEAMCRAESQILNVNNLTSLLTNERFHRCMLACSAEIVLATHKTVTMLFPAVLERTGITAFDLSKVIESFIRHEDSLPRELRRHLNSLEERLLESMVWEKGSSMYNSLAVARPTLSGEINRLGLLAEPMLSLDAIAMHINMSSSGGQNSVPLPVKHENEPGLNGDIRSPKRPCMEYRSVLVERNSFASPVKDRVLAMSNQKSKPHPALQSAFASPTRPNPGGGGETCAETAISVFFSKIVKLAAVRINGMVERLQLPQQIRESVYCLFQKILGHRATLFFNRHIDQIILCCFYGVAKISQLSLTFKEIIYNYQKQPHCKPQVFRSVFIDSSARRSGRSGPDHVDIISFYNEIFIPNVKPLLVELAPLGIAQKSNQSADAKSNNDRPSPASPKTVSFPSLPDMSPKKVSAAHNIYVSPLRQSKMDVLNSHTSKSYYACVGESTHAYQSPSKDLTAINNRLNGGVRKVVRGPLNFDGADGGLVSDSLVANALPLQNKTCASPSLVPLKSAQPDM